MNRVKSEAVAEVNEEVSSHNDDNGRLTRLYTSPLRLVLIVTATIFLAETIVMSYLFHYPELPEWLAIIMDSTLLLLLLIPILHYCVFRPLTLQISERQLVREALTLERNKLRGILDAMNDGVYIVNRDHDIEYLNSVLEKEFGPVAGQKCYEYFHDRSESCPFCKNPEVFAGKSVRWEWHSAKTGRTYDLFDTPIRNDDGTVSKLEIFHDITGIKESKEALQKERQRLFSVLDELPALVFLQAPDYSLRFANQVFLKRFGSTGKRPCYEVFHERTTPCEECPTFTVFETKEPIEWELSTCDGRTYEVHAYPFTDVDGTPLVLEHGIDVSDRRRAEDALTMERNKLRGILDAMDDAIFIVNREFEFTYTNTQVSNLFGPIESRTCREYFADMEELCPWKRQTAADPLLPVRTLLRVDRLGRLFEATILPIENHDGSTAMLEILHDITERRKSSEEVRNIYQAVEQNSTAVVIVDCHRRIEYVNPRFTALTGYSREEVYGRNPNILKGGNTTAEEYRQLWETITSGREWRGEFFNKKKSGELYWELNSISPIFNEEGEITNFVAVKEDITERKRVEYALRDSHEELRQLSAHLQQVREGERTTIAREIHDELGQSLATLQLSVSLLAAELEPGQTVLREQTREMSQLIAATVKGLQRLCAELRPVMIDELGLLAALEWQARQFEKKTGICCEFVFDLQTADLPPSVATALFRIYQEAMTNVIRHAEADLVEASLVEKGNWLTLRVRDNGKGIQPQMGSSKTSYGLIGMRERAASLGGKVRICSNQQKGTAVLARLPLVRMEVEQ